MTTHDHSKPIKILYVITSGEIGGAQTHLYDLISKLDRTHFQITVACSPSGPLLDTLTQLAIPVITIPSLKREIDISEDLKTLFTLFRICRRHKFDIMHAHSSKAGFLGRIAAYFARVPVIIFSVHGFAFNPEISPPRKKIYKLLEYLAGKVSRKVICVSRADLDQSINEGILSARRVLQIANGVDVGKFKHKHSEQLRKELGIPLGALVIGMVARLIPEKGQAIAIEAFSKIAHDYPKSYLLLIGDGPARQDYEQLARSLGLAERVLITGYRTDIPEILAALDVFVFTSQFEAMPYAVLEAMASKKPVVASAVGGITEVITDGESGYLTKPDDSSVVAEKLRILLGNPELRTRMGEKAHDRIVTHFNLEQTVQQTVSVYQQMLKAGSKSLRKLIPALLIIGDAVLINLAILAAFIIRFGPEIPAVNLSQYTQNIIWVLVLQVLIFNFFRLYEPGTRGFYKSILLPQITKAVALLFIALIFFRWLGQQLFDLPRSVILISSGLATLVITGWHFFIGKLFYLPTQYKNVLLVGSHEQVAKLDLAIKSKPHLGYDVVGYVNAEPPVPEAQVPEYLGSLSDIPKLNAALAIDSIIVIPEPDAYTTLIEELTIHGDRQLEIKIIPKLYDLMIGKTNFQLLADIPFVAVPTQPDKGLSYHLRRGLESAFAVLLLLASAPLLLLISCGLKALRPGPILSRVPRIGKDLVQFELLRFALPPQKQRSGSVSKWRQFILTVIQRYRLDGLPQLINILRGDMSFVGPQPESPELAQVYLSQTPTYKERFKVKPGVIGLAQVNGAYHTGDQLAILYDLQYIYNYSLFRDLIIIRDSLRRALKVAPY